MSQGSNMKQEVMEVLFDLPINKLSQKHLKWILSNLPDDNSKGNFQTKIQSDFNFQHSEDNVWEACGFTEGDLDECNKEMNHLVNMAKEAGMTKRSQIVQTIVENATNKQLSVLMVIGIRHVVLDKLDEVDSDISGKLDKLGGMLSKLQSKLKDIEKPQEDPFSDLPEPLRQMFIDMLNKSKKKDDDTE